MSGWFLGTVLVLLCVTPRSGVWGFNGDRGLTWLAASLVFFAFNALLDCVHPRVLGGNRYTLPTRPVSAMLFLFPPPLSLEQRSRVLHNSRPPPDQVPFFCCFIMTTTFFPTLLPGQGAPRNRWFGLPGGGSVPPWLFHVRMDGAPEVGCSGVNGTSWSPSAVFVASWTFVRCPSVTPPFHLCDRTPLLAYSVSSFSEPFFGLTGEL